MTPRRPTTRNTGLDAGFPRKSRFRHPARKRSSNILLNLVYVIAFLIASLIFIALSIAISAAPFVIVALVLHWLGAF